MAILPYLLILFPILSALAWLATLQFLFIDWAASGHPHLPSMKNGTNGTWITNEMWKGNGTWITNEMWKGNGTRITNGTLPQSIPYISDIAAQGVFKKVFIAGAVVTSVLLDAAMAVVIGRWWWIRDSGHRKKVILGLQLGLWEKLWGILALFWAMCGTAGLILLACYDTLHQKKLHDAFILLFMASYIMSAICICFEYGCLSRHYRQFPILRISFWLKVWFCAVETVLACLFALSMFWVSGRHDDIAAVFEWTMALIFTFWVLSFVVDLLPASLRARGGSLLGRGNDSEMAAPSAPMGGQTGDGGANAKPVMAQV